MKGLEELLCEHENSGCRETINLPTKPTRRRVLMCLLPAKVFLFPICNHTNSLGTKNNTQPFVLLILVYTCLFVSLGVTR